jgi:regulator of sirC expression with transglutaminase-like and TPR domain
MLRNVACLLICWLVFSVQSLPVVEEPKPEQKPPGRAAPAVKSVEQVAAAARNSVVVITFVGRDGKRQGLGTGFVISRDGLVATNLHVIGEGRPVSVQLADGKRYQATSVHASDRSLDLALLRIDARDLVPLEIGDSDALKEGQAVVAIGNPLGLTNSVVSGVVSAKRQMKNGSMIQLAIPIEPGNSGGPLLDLQGRVHGILTLKSSLTANLGFAVPINLLKPLLKKPNPIPMARWITIGTLDPSQWKTVFDARWRQRAGKILAEGAGSGFGGRALCLAQQPTPGLPYEMAVTVRLDDEAGAAGLAFYADGGDKHYGFYPSAGQLRLTRFDGPDVFSWKILAQVPSSHYHLGEWNTLKVRLEKGKILCYVNGHLVIESTDHELREGKVGLAKFRDTRAEFKNFGVAKEIPVPAIHADLTERIRKATDGAIQPGPAPSDLVEALIPDAPASASLLRERAKQLEEQAAHLRDLARAVHERRVQSELVDALKCKEDKIDLLHAALLVAKLDNDDLDVDFYRKDIERMAAELKAALPKNADGTARLKALNKYFFEECGFHGSRSDYYNRANSYLSDVLDDREGIPITLSVVYMELGRRIDLKMVGIGLPGHFVIRYSPEHGNPGLIDVFEGGQALSLVEARRKGGDITGQPILEEHLAPVTKKAIITRMLHNLLGVAQDEGDIKALLRYLNTILAISPDAGRERLLRAGARFQLADRQGALEDIVWLLEHRPEGVNVQRVLELQRLLTRPEK